MSSQHASSPCGFSAPPRQRRGGAYLVVFAGFAVSLLLGLTQLRFASTY
ncbi:hypothetical protein [Microbacterium lacticum]|nr:hypothetical protein [Microbacterium lacticum]